MKNLGQLAKSAKASLRDEHTIGKLRLRKEELFPLEVSASEYIDKEITRLARGETSLDAKFPRIDLDAALRSRKIQFGIPVPVPRFAAMNVKSKRLEIGATKTKWNGDPSYDYPKEFDAYRNMSISMTSHLTRRGLLLELLCRLPAIFIGVGAVLLCKYLIHIMPPHVEGQPPGDAYLCGVLVTGVVALWAGIHFIKRLGHAYIQRMSCKIGIEMGGALPDDARKAIKDNQSNFEDIYVVAEAKRWTMTRKQDFKLPEKRRVEADPLIIGRKNGCYYLIHTFDLTPVEKWLRAEFSNA